MKKIEKLKKIAFGGGEIVSEIFGELRARFGGREE